MDDKIIAKAQSWLSEDYDPETRKKVQELLDGDYKDLEDAFYKDLEFGTGGLRGVMGPGTNRMNRYTVGMATQGLANYLNEFFPDEVIHVAIAHDSRHKSDQFAKNAAEVFSANGIQVHLFEGMRPTPELSFAIRQLGCKSGIVITASHNPKEYNGYKVYWEDGAQIVTPHDRKIIEKVQAIKGPADVNFEANPDLIHSIPDEVDEAYLEMVEGLLLSKEAVDRESDLRIVYTPLHGTGVVHIPEILRRMGFHGLQVVESQAQPNGDFPTVESPNPEERVAMEQALKEADELGADLVMGTDPDADRVGVGIRDHHGKLILLNGNQAASLLVYYLLERRKSLGKLPDNAFVCKTIVTTDLIDRICEDYNVELKSTLTGFKHIATAIRENEGKLEYIGGGEESYGYMIGDKVRDKDAVASAALFAEMAAWARYEETTVFGLLTDLYRKYGFYKERLHYVVKKGREGADQITRMMEELRTDPPKNISGVEVVKLADYREGTIQDLKSGEKEATGLPKSNVIQFFLEDGSKITARPSGTEPKIKFYIAVKGTLDSMGNFDNAEEQIEHKIDRFLKEIAPD